MEEIKVYVKKLREDAIMPTKGTSNSAGFDLYALNTEVLNTMETKMIHTGLAFEIPEGYFGAVFARSGLSTKKGIVPATCVSVIDSDYRGEVTVPLRSLNKDEIVGIEKGDRVAQLIIIPYASAVLHESDSLTPTQRGDGGYGSTGA